jgi:hypothetical protein
MIGPTTIGLQNTQLNFWLMKSQPPLWYQHKPASRFSTGHLLVGGTSVGKWNHAIDYRPPVVMGVTRVRPPRTW